MNRIFVNEFRLLSIVSLFIELAGNLRSYRWSRNAATANNSRKQLWAEHVELERNPGLLEENDSKTTKLN